MKIAINDIADILRTEDIEGLIAIGAPADEYDSEAEKIAQAIEKLSASELTQANICAVIALLWAKSFNRSSEEIKQRMPAFERVAVKVLGL